MIAGAFILLVGALIGGTAGLVLGLLLGFLAAGTETAVEEEDLDEGEDHSQWCRALINSEWECDCA